MIFVPTAHTQALRAESPLVFVDGTPMQRLVALVPAPATLVVVFGVARSSVWPWVRLTTLLPTAPWGECLARDRSFSETSIQVCVRRRVVLTRSYSAFAAVLFGASHAFCSVVPLHVFSGRSHFCRAALRSCCRGNTAVARPHTTKEFCKKVLSITLLNDTIQTTWAGIALLLTTTISWSNHVHREIQLAYYSVFFCREGSS